MAKVQNRRRNIAENKI